MIKIIIILLSSILASWVLWMGVKIITKILKDIYDLKKQLKK